MSYFLFDPSSSKRCTLHLHIRRLGGFEARGLGSVPLNLLGNITSYLKPSLFTTRLGSIEDKHHKLQVSKGINSQSEVLPEDHRFRATPRKESEQINQHTSKQLRKPLLFTIRLRLEEDQRHNLQVSRGINSPFRGFAGRPPLR